MPKTRLQKEEAIIKLSEKIQRSKALIFTDFKGMTMTQLSDLRNKLREQDAEFNITKNTLLDRAIQSTNYKLPASTAKRGEPTTNSFEGSTATLFAYDDQITPIKILVKALKDNSIGKIKMGFLGSASDNELLDEVKIQKLATLPSKDELRAKTVGVLVAPLQGIVGVLQANLRNLVYALSEVQKMRGGEQ